MSRRYSSCRSLRSPNIRSSSTSEKPMTALSGVRSSCDMLARNSDLCWLATSSSALVRSSSRKSRALMMASADWLAKVCSSSQSRREKAPGVRRRTTRAPTIWSCRSSGTASSDRQPAVVQHARRCGSQLRAARSAICSGSAARGRAPDRASCRRRSGVLQRVEQLVARAVGAAGPRRPASSSYSMIEPPSVPDSWTAWRDDRGEHLVRSRLELTASPTSPAPRAGRPCGQLAPWASSSLNSCDVPDRDRRLRGERLQQLDRPLVERLDLGPPHREHPDDLVVDQHRRAEDRAEPAEARGPPATRSAGRHAHLRAGPSGAPAPTRPTERARARQDRVLSSRSR